MINLRKDKQTSKEFLEANPEAMEKKLHAEELDKILNDILEELGELEKFDGGEMKRPKGLEFLFDIMKMGNK